MKKKDLRAHYRRLGLRKRAARQLAQDVSAARAKRRSASVSSDVIDDLDALYRDIRPIARRSADRAKRRAKTPRPTAAKKAQRHTSRGATNAKKRP